MLYRERIGSLYTYGQSLFRIHFLALGRRMAEHGWIDQPEDLFYLHWHEIVDWVRGPSEGKGLRSRVQQRRAEVEACRDLEMPEIVYGDAPPLPVSRDKATVLNGAPTSPGRYRGPACVVHGIRDFGKIQPGDVLIVPFTDVGWTPLFTKAGAVVAESGGMLSHSSIIAREYEIPAVVSVNHACRLIADGTPVLVDGYHGRVSLEIEAPEPTKSGKEQRER
jgi:pyruvate,water dikinase